MKIYIDGSSQLVSYNCMNSNVSEFKRFIEKEWGLQPNDYYLLSNGKRIDEVCNLEYGKIHIVPTVLGGKGGFGSMLRAIGAQIEKTTNREACRDLSGRRLRDINEEQRLKNWINQQAEREKEAKDRKQKKLERLCEMPKHEFKDEQYDKERSELSEKVEDAVLCGLQASCSTKRKVTEKKPVIKKKKPKLWVDDELEDDLSSGSEDEDSDTEENKTSTGTSKTPDSENSVSSETANEEHTNVDKTEIGGKKETNSDKSVEKVEENKLEVNQSNETNTENKVEGNESPDGNKLDKEC